MTNQERLDQLEDIGRYMAARVRELRTALEVAQIAINELRDRIGDEKE